MDIQQQVENLKVWYEPLGRNISLQDVCFAPLAPDNKNCTIQSILNYWQNSHDMIDKVATDEWGFLTYADYVDHFQFCVR